MTALALHFPERRSITRWMLAAVAIVIAHGIMIGALALWHTRAPPEENLIPAIVVSIVPAAPLSPMENDQPVAAEETRHIDPTPEPSKVETKVELPPEEIKPPPPRPAEIALPKPEPKPVEKKPFEKKPVEKRRVEKFSPPQEAHERAATREASRQSSVAASNSYASLVYGHLQRFKSYPASANGATGNVVARFVLSRAGNLLSASIVRSSGNAALDAEALASLRRASPFPLFPEAKTGAQDSFTAPMNYGR
jgi:periplasmic protein TonB